ncbi:DUF5134 domain-containing protein [Streptomyces sp. NPDC004232]|uniref:DUF5134 domain-containing protein n=1 Tax=Streptomyces sp. NPDC004232 TaxID=3154454 RepID=UPI001DEC8CAA|nr:DUF5134 domain-containing protein [Streptomyces sp. tea 10]
MNAADAVPTMLTVLFAAVVVHALRFGVLARGSGWRRRVDHLLHAAMALVMAAMPWPSVRVLPELPQTFFFAAAALWFPLSAAYPGQRYRPAAAVRRLPYAAGMAAMAWMSHRAATTMHEVPAADLVTAMLALYLLASALRSLTRDMPALRGTSAATDNCLDSKGTYDRFWDGTMALGTAITLLMHH